MKIKTNSDNDKDDDDNGDRRQRKSTQAPATRSGCGRYNLTIGIAGIAGIAGIVAALALAPAFVSLFSISTPCRIVTSVDAVVFMNPGNRPGKNNHSRWRQEEGCLDYSIRSNRKCCFKYPTTPSFVSQSRIKHTRQCSGPNLSSKPNDSEYFSEILLSPPHYDNLDETTDSTTTASFGDAEKLSDYDSVSDSSSVFSPTAEQTPAFENHEMNTISEKSSEQKRYDFEIKEAFAQQTRERNPLLGVKSIGVDYGLVRTGVAVTIGYNPEALDVIVTDNPLRQSLDIDAEVATDNDINIINNNSTLDEVPNDDEQAAEKYEKENRFEIQRQTVAEKVVEWAFRENADRIVVGLPLHKNGTEAPQTVLTRKFARDHLAVAALRTLGPTVSIYLSDERYTSKEAAARMRSSSQHGHVTNNKKKNNNDMYGLLDAESAKIILEQYYNDHIDRYTNRNIDYSGTGDNSKAPAIISKAIDYGVHYNGELVTIPDTDLVEALILEYKERKRIEREKLAADRTDREARVRWRRQAMEEDRMRAQEQFDKTAAKGRISLSKKKKKKKKRKRK